jgi:hypothetical protein
VHKLFLAWGRRRAHNSWDVGKKEVLFILLFRNEHGMHAQTRGIVSFVPIDDLLPGGFIVREVPKLTPVRIG